MWRSLGNDDRLVSSIGELHISTKSEDIRSDIYRPPVSALWDRIEAPTRDYDPSSGKPAYRTQYGLEEAERDIIENLEREERERHLKQTTEQDEYIDPWKVHNLKPRRINKIETFESNRSRIDKRNRIVEEERITSRHESETEGTVIIEKR